MTLWPHTQFCFDPDMWDRYAGEWDVGSLYLYFDRHPFSYHFLRYMMRECLVWWNKNSDRPHQEKWFHVSESVVLADGRRVCPECRHHPQGYSGLFIDCKNIFYDLIDGKKVAVGQCCCWSPLHGGRY